jgi:hypothetical protein
VNECAYAPRRGFLHDGIGTREGDGDVRATVRVHMRRERIRVQAVVMSCDGSHQLLQSKAAEEAN